MDTAASAHTHAALGAWRPLGPTSDSAPISRLTREGRSSFLIEFEEAVAAIGWGLRVAENVGETAPPSAAEPAALRSLTA